MKRGNIKISISQELNKKNNEFEVECFFIDLDGTLLDGKRHSISDLNAEKIKEINQNTPVVISTGRSFGSKVKGLMKSLNIEYAICQNGAIIANNKNEILQEIFMDTNMVSLIKQVAKKYRVIIIPDSKYRLYSNVLYLKPLI
jgi:HAD superfamily hydrolase (TIGR01484 family)